MPFCGWRTSPSYQKTTPFYHTMRSSLTQYVFFVVFCGVMAETPYYPSCRNSIKAIPNMGTTSCSSLLCSSRYKPVCGSDGEEYINNCSLCKAACINPKLIKQCDGFCPCAEMDPTPVLDLKRPPTVAASGFCLAEGTCPK